METQTNRYDRAGRGESHDGSEDYTWPRVDRRRRRPGAPCPACGEFVEERWATVVDGRLVFLCWSGHRWVDRRAPVIPNGG